MRSYRMTFAYDGTAYCGWQIQPGVPTVQEAIESALQRITGQQVRVTASGRTDTGVHAQQQVASFRCQTRLEPSVLCRAVNAQTPDDICIREVSLAAPDFHAIRDAVSKRYRYLIQDAMHHDLFQRAYSWRLTSELDVDGMRQAAHCLLGQHDFSSFEAAGAPRKTSVRTVLDLQIERQRSDQTELVSFEIEADGFLYNMVRNIVGSLVLVGQHRQSITWMAELLAAKDRQLAGPTAPAHGLTLLKVRYKRDIGIRDIGKRDIAQRSTPTDAQS